MKTIAIALRLTGTGLPFIKRKNELRKQQKVVDVQVPLGESPWKNKASWKPQVEQAEDIDKSAEVPLVEVGTKTPWG
jgi:hypothetical protein